MVSFLAQNLRWLLAGVLLTFSSSYGQTFFISVFAGEIREAFSLSHGEWGSIYTLGTTLSAGAMLWAGGLTDRFRVRVLGPVVLVLLAGACAFMATIQSVWLLPIAIFALRFAGQGMSSHIALVAMARWFTATRGKALSIATLGVSGGQAILPIVFVAALNTWHWQDLWLLAAGLALLGIPVLIWSLLEERTPGAHATESETTGMHAEHWTRRMATRHFLFWSMVPAILGPAAFNTAFFFQQVHFTEVKGFNHLDLVALFPLYTVISIVAMLGSGWALDRFGTARLVPLYQAPMVVAFVLFAFGESFSFTAGGMALLAITAGANATLPSAFWAEFYGTRHIGSIKALAASIMVLGSAIGPGLTGILIDTGIGIEIQYFGIAVYFALTTLAMLIGVRRAKPDLPVAPQINVVGS